jgi:hypothetical protein
LCQWLFNMCHVFWCSQGLLFQQHHSYCQLWSQFILFSDKLLMLWSKVLLEKLIVTQLLKEFLTFYRIQRFSTCLQPSCTKITWNFMLE